MASGLETPHRLVYLENVQVQVKGCRVTLDCYLWSMPTVKELTMLWISCTLNSHGRALTLLSVHKEAFVSKTLIYVYYLMLHIKWKNERPHFRERRPRQAEDWSWGGGWKVNRGFAALALMLHKIEHKKIGKIFTNHQHALSFKWVNVKKKTTYWAPSKDFR